MRLKACSVFFLSFFVLSAHLPAFNGQKKGFILGGGIGAGYLSYKETSPEFKLNRFAGAGNFKIGYAPTDSFEIYFVGDLSMFGYLFQGDVDDMGVTVIGFNGLGLTKYLSTRGTGFFVSGGVGISFLSFFSTRTGSGDVNGGLGLLGGIGYDLSRHWRIQGDVVYTNLPAAHTKSLGFRVTFNFLAF